MNTAPNYTVFWPEMNKGQASRSGCRSFSPSNAHLLSGLLRLAGIDFLSSSPPTSSIDRVTVPSKRWRRTWRLSLEGNRGFPSFPSFSSWLRVYTQHLKIVFRADTKRGKLYTMNHSKLYQNELTHLGYGKPVWEPNPDTQYDCIRIGDVGYFENDQFIPLFNILPPTSDDLNRGIQFSQPNFQPLVIPDNLPTVQRTNPLEAGVYGLESSLTFSASVGVDRWAWGFTIVRIANLSLIYNLTVLDRYSRENLLYLSPTRKEQHSFFHPRLVVKIQWTASCSKITCSNTIANGTHLPWQNAIVI